MSHPAAWTTDATRRTSSGAGRARPATVVPLVLGAVGALAIEWPFLIQGQLPLRPVVVVLLAVVLVYELARTPALTRFVGPAIIAIPFVTVLVVRLTAPLIADGQPVVGANLQRYLVVLPLGLLVGVVLWRSPSVAAYARGALGVTTVTALAAIAEFVLATSFLGRNYRYFVEGGYGRAMLGSDHPLVLGTLFAVAIPLAGRYRGWDGALRVLVLTAGVVATRSLGPIIVASGLALLMLAPRVRGAVLAHRRLLAALLLAGLGALVWLSTRVWTSQVPGNSSALYSQNYRTALYAVTPTMLREAPWGYGPGSLPAGRWLVYSEFKGVRDLATTIDTEYVYLVSEWGYLGLALGVLVLLLSIRAISASVNLALTALAFVGCGFFVAVHPWDTLGTAWAIVLGMVIAAITAPRAPDGLPPDGPLAVLARPRDGQRHAASSPSATSSRPAVGA